MAGPKVTPEDETQLTIQNPLPLEGASSLGGGPSYERICSAVDYIHPWEDMPQCSLTLPPNIYTAAVIVPLGSRLGDKRGVNLIALAMVVPQMFFCLANIALQACFVWWINNISHGKAGCPADPFLRSMCITLYVFVNLQDLQESGCYVMWLLCVHTSAAFEHLRFRKSNERLGQSEELASGLPVWYKLLMFATVIMPKLAIAVALLVFGGQYILKSDDNESIVLNTLAVTFITQIDEYCYAFFTSRFIKNVIESVPPVHISSRYHRRYVMVSQVLGPYINTLVVAGLAFWIYNARC